MSSSRYAVVGTPVAHSLSPRIHAAFAAECGQDLTYQAIEIPLDDFETRVRRLQSDDYAGLNVTVPFKQQAWRICNSTSDLATAAGAVNVLSFAAGGEIHGDNTDGIGLRRDLETNLGIDLGGLSILMLGAGGAVRGVLPPLLAGRPAKITIANRTLSRARALEENFTAVEAVGYDALDDRRYDLVINGTSASLSGELPPLPARVVGDHCLCYDMMYRQDGDTPFVAWARRQGARLACDGLGMLVEQAAEAFLIWRGMRPSTGALIRLLRTP